MNSELQELDQNSLEKVLALVHKHTGISMGVNKKTLLQGRLRPRIRSLGLLSYEEYIDLLRTSETEVQEFINIVTTNETSFFRTQRIWDYLSNEFLPAWTSQYSKRPLKIWSGAASSGEEIYTIGICCEEHLLKNPGFSYQILGTDISSSVLDQATLGEYSGRSIESFKTKNRSLFDKYLEPGKENFRIREAIRGKIKFKSQNLFHRPPQVETFDLVFLRNVLIYFDRPDQEKVLANVSLALVNNGTLIIGESESLNSLKTTFEYKFPLIYQKKISRND